MKTPTRSPRTVLHRHTPDDRESDADETRPRATPSQTPIHTWSPSIPIDRELLKCVDRIPQASIATHTRLLGAISPAAVAGASARQTTLSDSISDIATAAAATRTSIAIGGSSREDPGDGRRLSSFWLGFDTATAFAVGSTADFGDIPAVDQRETQLELGDTLPLPKTLQLAEMTRPLTPVPENGTRSPSTASAAGQVSAAATGMRRSHPRQDELDPRDYESSEDEAVARGSATYTGAGYDAHDEDEDGEEDGQVLPEPIYVRDLDRFPHAPDSPLESATFGAHRLTPTHKAKIHSAARRLDILTPPDSMEKKQRPAASSSTAPAEAGITRSTSDASTLSAASEGSVRSFKFGGFFSWRKQAAVGFVPAPGAAGQAKVDDASLDGVSTNASSDDLGNDSFAGHNAPAAGGFATNAAAWKTRLNLPLPARPASEAGTAGMSRSVTETSLATSAEEGPLDTPGAASSSPTGANDLVAALAEEKRRRLLAEDRLVQVEAEATRLCSVVLPTDAGFEGEEFFKDVVAAVKMAVDCYAKESDALRGEMWDLRALLKEKSRRVADAELGNAAMQRELARARDEAASGAAAVHAQRSVQDVAAAHAQRDELAGRVEEMRQALDTRAAEVAALTKAHDEAEKKQKLAIEAVEEQRDALRQTSRGLRQRLTMLQRRFDALSASNSNTAQSGAMRHWNSSVDALSSPAQASTMEARGHHIRNVTSSTSVTDLHAHRLSGSRASQHSRTASSVSSIASSQSGTGEFGGAITASLRPQSSAGSSLAATNRKQAQLQQYPGQRRRLPMGLSWHHRPATAAGKLVSTTTTAAGADDARATSSSSQESYTSIDARRDALIASLTAIDYAHSRSDVVKSAPAATTTAATAGVYATPPSSRNVSDATL